MKSVVPGRKQAPRLRGRGGVTPRMSYLGMWVVSFMQWDRLPSQYFGFTLANKRPSYGTHLSIWHCLSTYNLRCWQNRSVTQKCEWLVQSHYSDMGGLLILLKWFFFDSLPCQNLISANAKQKIRGISFVESLAVPHECISSLVCITFVIPFQTISSHM
jgi:hypothetical protein